MTDYYFFQNDEFDRPQKLIAKIGPMIQDEQMRLDLQKWNEQPGKMDKD